MRLASRWTGPLCGGVLALALASTTVAGDRAHNGGFFLRLSGGVGGASTEVEYFGANRLEGPSGDINLAIGAVVARNLAIHGTIWGWVVSDPEATLAGINLGDVDGDLMYSAAGVGLTYYFMPVNIYLSGSVGAGSFTMDSGGDSFDSGTGVALDLTLGKEWWVGTSWGLGLALSGGYHSVGDDGFLVGTDIGESWSGGNVALRFSATLN